MTGAAIVGRITRTPVAVSAFNGAPFVSFRFAAPARAGAQRHYACFTVSQIAREAVSGLAVGALVAITPRNEIMTGRGMAPGVRCIASWSTTHPPGVAPHAGQPK